MEQADSSQEPKVLCEHGSCHERYSSECDGDEHRAWLNILHRSRHHTSDKETAPVDCGKQGWRQGGTTGTTKGIVLTNRNFNALGQQVIAANPMFRPGDKMLAAMPPSASVLLTRTGENFIW